MARLIVTCDRNFNEISRVVEDGPEPDLSELTRILIDGAIKYFQQEEEK